jgi:putative transposase
MKKPRYTESQIFKILKEAENEVAVPELCRKHGMSDASFYTWRAKYGGMDVSNMTRLRELEEENRRLKTMYPESRMDCEILREAMVKK